MHALAAAPLKFSKANGHSALALHCRTACSCVVHRPTHKLNFPQAANVRTALFQAPCSSWCSAAMWPRKHVIQTNLQPASPRQKEPCRPPDPQAELRGDSLAKEAVVILQEGALGLAAFANRYRATFQVKSSCTAVVACSQLPHLLILLWHVCMLKALTPSDDSEAIHG